MAASVWKGSISLSLVTIPVRLYVAARSVRTNLHQVHKVCNTRVRQPLFCPTCNRFVDRKEIVKGYEAEDGQYVLVDENEIKKLAAASSRNLEVVAFTHLKEIDPILFDASYFCLPEEAGKKAYQLLVKALEDTQTVGIGKLVMHQRDYTVFLRAYQHGLLLHTMYFLNEIQRLPEYGVLEPITVKSQELKLTEQLIDALMEKFQPKQYHDEFQDKLKKLIESKAHGKPVEIESAPKLARVIDMMAALKKSLAAASASSGKAAHERTESAVQPARKRIAAKSRKAAPVRKAS